MEAPEHILYEDGTFGAPVASSPSQTLLKRLAEAVVARHHYRSGGSYLIYCAHCNACLDNGEWHKDDCIVLKAMEVYYD